METYRFSVNRFAAYEMSFLKMLQDFKAKHAIFININLSLIRKRCKRTGRRGVATLQQCWWLLGAARASEIRKDEINKWKMVLEKYRAINVDRNEIFTKRSFWLRLDYIYWNLKRLLARIRCRMSFLID